MVINNKKSPIQMDVGTPLPESLLENPRMDETTYKYLGFEMRKEMKKKEMMNKLEERIKDKLEEPSKRVGSFEARNWIHFNQNAMSVVRFYSGPSSSPSGGLTGWTEPSASI